MLRIVLEDPPDHAPERPKAPAVGDAAADACFLAFAVFSSNFGRCDNVSISIFVADPARVLVSTQKFERSGALGTTQEVLGTRVFASTASMTRSLTFARRG